MKTKTIKKIKKLKSKIKIIFDDETLVEILPNTFTEFRLYEGKILTTKEIRDLKEFNKCENLYDFMVKKFLIKSYTFGKVKELIKKKSDDEEIIEKVLARLIKNGFIDDQVYIDEILEHADYKHFGYKKIIQKLWNLKITPALINKVKYDETREKKEAANFIKIVEPKFSNLNNSQKKKKIYEALLRNGFESDISLELVNKIANSNYNHEINVLKLDYAKAYAKYSKTYNGALLRNKIECRLLRKGYKITDIRLVEGK